ncbi:MAG: NADH-quinone oxidoreductase subunit L [Planctomycetota bacterium]|nr:MAG: NADH-quinone oxidoreductase subunit L [Planctomycetota bacterium]
MDLTHTLPILLGIAWLLPLASFTTIFLLGPRLGRNGELGGLVATGAILGSFSLSFISLIAWISQHPLSSGGEHVHAIPAIVGDWYTLAAFGDLRLSIGYYIDALTVGMFTMVTLIASCIHVYSFGYMHEELEDFHDPLVTLSDGNTLTRPGRFHRFYQFLSLFCFSMLGLVVAGNLFMVFAFWELVGVCSYLLIGFYVERKSASNAANKAFIVNRVGDFGMLIGLMTLLGTLGTLHFGDLTDAQGNVRAGLFSQVRPLEAHHELIVPEGMRRLAAADNPEAAEAASAGVPDVSADGEHGSPVERGTLGYWLLVVGGLGVFCGCVGKSAQFPLHVWLPDAMEGPTPVSALIHAATMVAAGVYLVGRCYPLFTPEVLLVIAVVGTITLFLAASIAVTATDIKRVLAYSTVSQLGYMMLALGVGGWVAGLFHLFTHAFFKALLFLCSGSVIHACGTNEMPQMGGLRKKMPWTAGTMLVGCLAIAGAGIPLVIGLSGFHSKDAILAQAYSLARTSPLYGWFFYVALAGAAITAFYMFRLWYMTFAGTPRDEHVYAHAHESPRSMVGPLVVLAFFAVVAGWRVPFTGLSLPNLLEQARPAGTAEGFAGGAWIASLHIPAEHASHAEAIHVPVSLMAFSAALVGFILATLFYGTRRLDPGEVVRHFAGVYRFLYNKWYFDELYWAIFVRPAHRLAAAAAWVDRRMIDWFADHLALWTRMLSDLDGMIDRLVVDGIVNRLAAAFYNIGLALRKVQSGKLRVYVMWIAAGTVGLFVLVTWYWSFLTAVGAS